MEAVPCLSEHPPERQNIEEGRKPARGVPYTKSSFLNAEQTVIKESERGTTSNLADDIFDAAKKGHVIVVADGGSGKSTLY